MVAPEWISNSCSRVTEQLFRTFPTSRVRSALRRNAPSTLHIVDALWRRKLSRRCGSGIRVRTIGSNTRGLWPSSGIPHTWKTKRRHALCNKSHDPRHTLQLYAHHSKEVAFGSKRMCSCRLVHLLLGVFTPHLQHTQLPCYWHSAAGPPFLKKAGGKDLQ